MSTTKTPDDAARHIVETYASDLSESQQDALRVAIEDAMKEWGDLVDSTTYESMGG